MTRHFNDLQSGKVEFFTASEVYYEKRPVAGILVVNETTADPGIVGVIPISVYEDHVSICKPASKDSQIYRRVKRLVEDIVAATRPPVAKPPLKDHVMDSQPPAKTPADSDFGQVKIDLCRRLGGDWPLLADYFNIEPAERARFDRGWEPQRVWEWLEARGRLAELTAGLRYIGQGDLAELIGRPRQARRITTPIPSGLPSGAITKRATSAGRSPATRWTNASSI